MVKSIHEQLEGAVLSSIRCGRCLAESWEASGIRPSVALCSLLPQTLYRLSNGEPLAINDETALELMAEEMKEALNQLKPGYGDLAMRIDTSEHLVFDRDREELRKLVESWKSFRNSRQVIQDLQAAIRQLKLLQRRSA